MKDIDKKIKTNRQADFIREHTLSPEEKHKLIQDKIERAKQYHTAWKKREALCGVR
jgi:hypothetical protein